MSQPEQFDILILGSGEGGKKLARHMARSGRRTAVVERRWIGGSCPNIACLPSKNEIWSARIAYLTQHAAQFGTMIAGSVTTDMAKVRQRKRNMVEGEIALHLHNYQTTSGNLGIGKETAKHLVAHGASVLIGGRDEAKLRSAAAEIGGSSGKVRALAGDISSPATGAAIVESAERHFGGLDKFDSGTRWPSFTTQGGGR